MCSGGTPSDSTAIEDSLFCNFDLTYLPSCPPPPHISCDEGGSLEGRIQVLKEFEQLYLSGILPEIPLQQLEDSHIKSLLESKYIMFYSRYVDDIIVIYNATRTNPETIVQHANSMHSNIQLTPTLESNNQISFLDLLIIRKSHQLEYDVYRKPTATDTTINYLLIKSHNGTQTSFLQIVYRKDAKYPSQPHPPTQGMANHTSHSHIQRLPNHLTTLTKTTNTA